MLIIKEPDVFTRKTFDFSTKHNNVMCVLHALTLVLFNLGLETDLFHEPSHVILT